MNIPNIDLETSQKIALLEKIPNTESMIQQFTSGECYRIITKLGCGNFEEGFLYLMESPDIPRTETINGESQFLPWTPSGALKAGITDIEKDVLLGLIRSDIWKLIISVRSNRKKIELTLPKKLTPDHQEKRNTKERHIKKFNKQMNALLMSTLNKK